MRVVILVRVIVSLAACAALGCGKTRSAIEPAVEPAELQRVADAEGALAVRLLNQLAEEHPGANLLVGPDSILSALTLAASGANGATRDEILAALALAPAQDAPLAAVAALQFRLARAADADGIELATVHRLWFERSQPLVEAWTQRVETQFDDAFEALDFKGEPDAARDRINGFVADATNDKIRDLMPADSISGLTRLVITNATWFKGSWAHEFDRDDTRPARFTKRDGSTVEAQFMAQKERFGFVKSADGVALEMPYEGGELAMLIIVPNDAAAIRSWAHDAFARRAKELKEVEVSVFVPRFTFRGRYALAPVFTTLGVKDAFDAQRADFERMSAAGDLHVAGIYHQTFIEVNEEGTEAAAATGMEMAVTAEMTSREFRADRPFAFAIRHRPTGAVLFAGIVEDPTQG